MTRTSPIWVQEVVVIYLRIPTQKIDVVAEFGFNLMANTNTSAFDAIVSNGTFKLFH